MSKSIQSISGIINAAPSKSHEQRLLAAALLSRGECSISNFGSSDDVIAARGIIENLGAKISVENDLLHILPSQDLLSDELQCNESGLCARLFTPIAAIFKTAFTVNGSGSLLKRPVAESFYLLKQMGCIYEAENDKLPVKFTRTNIQSGQYYIDGSKSSQFVSGLIMALSVVYGDSTVVVKNPVSINYILMTIEVAKSFGVSINYFFEAGNELKIEIPGNQTYKAGTYTVEGDWSGAAFILAAAAINAMVGVKGLSADSLQADKDILKVFDIAGVKYFWQDDTLFVEKSEISGFDFDATNCPDLIPVLAILAIFASGTSRISGASRLKTKESSRAEVLQNELAQAGIKISINEDILQINGEQSLKSASLNSHGDHRMAMAFSVLGMFASDVISVENRDCVSKSYPDFYLHLSQILT